MNSLKTDTTDKINIFNMIFLRTKCIFLRLIALSGRKSQIKINAFLIRHYELTN